MSQDTHLFSVRRPRETLGGLSHNAFSNIPQPASALKRSSSSSNLQQHAFGATGMNGAKDGAGAANQHARSQSSSRASLAPPSMRPPQPAFAGLQRSSSNGVSRMSYAPLQTPARPMAGSYGGSYTGGAMTTGGLHTGFNGGPSGGFHSGPNGTQRRSSVYSRPSTSGAALMAQPSFFAQAPVTAGQTADRRRLRDRGVQLAMAQEMEEYLAQHNFQMDMKHALRPDTLRNPTQKDFTLLFQWLYKRIDPAYVFQKSMDAEVPPILKQLRYPFEKSITKSALMAVGGQNWSTFLGMLHWLMQLATMMERYVSERYDYACAEDGLDVTSDRIMFRFLKDAYATWLSSPQGEEGEDDEAKILAPHVDAMAAEFERGNEGCAEQLRQLEAEHEALEKQIAEAERDLPDLDKLDGYVTTLESDLKKFEAWQTNVVAKLKKNESRNEGIRTEIEQWERSLEESTRERAELQQAVDAQGIAVADIDRMNGERERLQSGVDSARSRLDDAATRIKEREQDASDKLANLESLAREFNTLCYDVGVRESDFELLVQINEPPFGSSQQGSSGGGDRLLADAETGYDPRRILNLDMRGKVKTHINSVKKGIVKRRTDARERDEEAKRLMFEVSHAIDDKRMEVEALDHKVRIAREEYEKTRDNANTTKLSSDAQIERAEKEMAKMRAEFTEDVQLMEQKELNTQFQYEQLVARGNAIREDLHTRIDDVLNLICKFKMHVQDNLAAYETMVEDECGEHDRQIAAMSTQKGQEEPKQEVDVDGMEE